MESKYSRVALPALRRCTPAATECHEDWDLADLRERLGVNFAQPAALAGYSSSRVLEPACAEINHLTGIGVTWEPIKRGRKVVGIRLSTWRKSREEIVEAQAELDRHRVGRKARREGLVERLDAERAETRRDIQARLAEIDERRAQQRAAEAAADPRQTDLEEAIAAANVAPAHPGAVETRRGRGGGGRRIDRHPSSLR